MGLCVFVCSEHTHTYVFRRPVASDSFGASVTHCELPDVGVGNSDHLLFLTTEPLFSQLNIHVLFAKIASIAICMIAV